MSKFPSNHHICISSAFLFFEKTLHSMKFTCLLVLHFEHYSEVPATHNRITISIKYGTKIGKGCKVIFSSLNGFYIF